MTKWRQLPSINDAKTFMAAVKDTLGKLTGSSTDRAITAKELMDTGIAVPGKGGVLVPGFPAIDYTVPKKLTNLTAIGAMDNIMLSWDPPESSNYSLAEVWRSAEDDIGTAVMVGSSRTTLYTDPVGRGATYFYWVRPVSKANVVGEFNAARGIQGSTGKDPAYVMDLLTSKRWRKTTGYAPYEYVLPTVDNGCQYQAVDGGTSGDLEPAWPTTPGQTVIDGTVEWRCLAASEMIPFAIGTLPDGKPAVYIYRGFIEEASISSAQIGSLAADKITAGKLRVGQDIELGSAIWAGFNLYANPNNVQGFRLGMDGGIPKFHLNTGGANGYYFKFTGTTFELNADTVSSANGSFKNLKTSLLMADYVYTRNNVVPTLYARNFPFSADEIKLYLRYNGTLRISAPQAIANWYHQRKSWDAVQNVLQTAAIKPFKGYNEPDATNFLRNYSKRNTFILRWDGNPYNSGNPGAFFTFGIMAIKKNGDTVCLVRTNFGYPNGGASAVPTQIGVNVAVEAYGAHGNMTMRAKCDIEDMTQYVGFYGIMVGYYYLGDSDDSNRQRQVSLRFQCVSEDEATVEAESYRENSLY